MSSSVSKQSRISLANIITLVTCVALVSVSWGTMNAQVVDLEERVGTLESRTLVQLESLNTGMNNLRVEVAKVSNDLEWLKKEMAEK
jgi:uncharacterized coiled-coil protein SlyX